MDTDRNQRWHPGEHEAVSCTSKHRYKTAGEAGHAKEAIRRRRRIAHTDQALQVYRCQYCHCWHLGRPTKKKHLKAKRRGQGNYPPPDKSPIWL